jgi:hypothetical protein
MELDAKEFSSFCGIYNTFGALDLHTSYVTLFTRNEISPRLSIANVCVLIQFS